MPRIFLTGLVICALAACRAPDLSGEVKGLTGSFTAVETRVTRDLGPAAQQEERVIIDAAISRRETVARVTPGCTAYMNRVPGATIDACRLQRRPLEDPAPGSARLALAHIGYLSDYIDALTLLANSNEPAEIGKSAGVVSDAVGNLARARPDSAGLASLAAELKGKKSTVSGISTALANQYKLRQLRQITRTADPAVAASVDLILAYYDSDPSSSERRAFARLETVQVEARRLRSQGTVPEYRAAVATLESAQKAYVDAARRGPTGTLIALKNAHAALTRRLAKPQDAAEAVAYLKQLKTFIDLVKAL